MYDDFYEPSDFDIMIENFKDELRKSVKEEYTNKIKELEDKLADLSDIRDNWNAKCMELEAIKRECEVSKRDAEKVANKKRLKELLIPFKHEAWGIDSSYVYLTDKCDKCDESSYIHYKSPQGHDVKEQCDCRRRQNVYKPIPATLYKIADYGRGPEYLYRYNLNLSFNADEWQELSNKDVYDHSTLFEEIPKPYYEILFLDKEDAEKYCEWKNAKKAQEDEDK